MATAEIQDALGGRASRGGQAASHALQPRRRNLEVLLADSLPHAIAGGDLLDHASRRSSSAGSVTGIRQVKFSHT